MKNGFTVLEMMIVMMMVVMLATMFTFASSRGGSSLFSRTILETLNREQYLAMATRSTRKVSFHEFDLETQNGRVRYPVGLSCTPADISWNAKGSISRAGSIHCRTSNSSFRIVMQLGTGRARTEPE